MLLLLCSIYSGSSFRYSWLAISSTDDAAVGANDGSVQASV